MSKKLRISLIATAVLMSSSAISALPEGYPADYQKLVDGAKKEGKVVIYSTTDVKAAGPLIQGFEATYPGVKVEYNDMNSTELYNRFISEQAAGGNSGDVVWSSSMDTALKLATDYAQEYTSPEHGQLPKWAVWKEKAYGTTYEPVVFIYNKRLIPAGDVPDSHAALAKLIASQTDKFKKKVTTYDIEKSGLGFMLSVEDFKADPNYFKTLADVAKGGLAVQSSTGTMMERVSSGENLIGFNILGSYAEARAKTDPSLGISYPKDYTLVLSRVSFISKEAKNSNAARLWLDYVLSEKGQSILANQGDIPSIRNDIEGNNDIDGMTKMLGNALKPIPVDETLLEYLQQKKRLDYIKQWREAAAK
ncbi:MAG: ABC transporter substrate-binding protein [Ewingella americana]|jgi:iron(III) transport system substrate-binding protein|uniref:Periplasmic substrate-binding component of an ABC superfamily iron transporter n=2 Tax=Ewingella americana TaxID=41202 RepID=A0A085GJL1_EWIA3|nr:ABC transporter substrate-binding protein [Ewingella americana]KAA8729230.1 ABC transporter substrate-binding protein [Ewingella americana]KFC83906.1 periplasmic substrate-binding component of an ABC superfamily iron transporter [Ewingella americana ATCC 33852]MCI1677164.1 ABC transporter substrate-binding protein [Ewingella americana]MCI1853246.1 ABC transporter substrate-binding protein [Ewingella americana]MCI1860513.1 ABC transporter substrate-binding protein [Ewingella americana]